MKQNKINYSNNIYWNLKFVPNKILKSGYIEHYSSQNSKIIKRSKNNQLNIWHTVVDSNITKQRSKNTIWKKNKKFKLHPCELKRLQYIRWPFQRKLLYHLYFYQTRFFVLDNIHLSPLIFYSFSNLYLVCSFLPYWSWFQCEWAKYLDEIGIMKITKNILVNYNC